MKGLNMDHQQGGDERLGMMHQEMMKLKRSMNRSNCIVAALGALVFILTIALIAVGAMQGHAIMHLKARQGLLPHPNVTFATRSCDRNVDGLTYGGSLFRGSGFWSAKTSLKGGSLTDHAAIGYGEMIFVLGGAKEGGNVTSEVWRYDSVLHNYSSDYWRVAPRFWSCCPHWVAASIECLATFRQVYAVVPLLSLFFRFSLYHLPHV